MEIIPIMIIIIATIIYDLFREDEKKDKNHRSMDIKHGKPSCGSNQKSKNINSKSVSVDKPDPSKRYGDYDYIEGYGFIRRDRRMEQFKNVMDFLESINQLPGGARR